MRVERWTALAGLAFVATTVGAVVTESAGPDVTKSPAAVAAKLGSDRSGVLINSALHIAAGVAVLLFAAGLAAVVRKGEGGRPVSHVVLAAGAATAAASGLTAVMAATVASSVHHLHDSQAVYVLYRGAASGALASMIFFAVALAAAAVGLTESGLVGRAWTRIALPVAGVLFIGGFGFLAPDAGPLSVVQVLGGVFALAYVVALSTALLGAARSQDAAQTRVSTVASTG